ncbi:hypothetical protein IU474_27940 [Nocardia otitidiscaviarum]|uniref:hypothetical protein n=1 Tax=Nocardia otitidiscaviarum TaxID=1823 RepID=UPI0018936FE5|nr:hypothetical protein [Nocardia otitidiscaviarum]MBF6240884.1 hypothetical protein [Nocardia otitidiscaviarum]
MTDNEEIQVELDDRILERLAWLICGDDGPLYRSVKELEQFFRAAGWTWVGEFDGTRRDWVERTLYARRRDPKALRNLLLRLADPREYLDEPSAEEQTVHELNELLAVEGLRVGFEHHRPTINRAKSAGGRFDTTTRMTLTADLAALVQDATFGAQLQSRLQDAHICVNAGAHMAATIMLGSLLEGVLYDVARTRLGTSVSDHLERLINLAHEHAWIARDVVDYAHVLRRHRNLIHPRRQWVDSYQPDADSAQIAWNVVVAALNDLAAEDTAAEMDTA